MTLWSNNSAAPDPNFVALACEWMDNPGHWLLHHVWAGYEHLCLDQPMVDERDLERSISQLLARRIEQSMSGDEPFYILHNPFERATMLAPPAQPPAYDLAFVMQADERIMWPLEAKVLETAGQVASYVADIEQQFLTCRYAPFSGSGAMLGYLLKGTAEEAFHHIASRLACTLTRHETPAPRAWATSRHQRTVPPGKAWPRDFVCHHLIMLFHGLRRQTQQSI